MHASELWSSDSWSARLARGALTPLSWFYAAGWQTYLCVYRLGLKRPAEPHRPVLVIGNLTVGGSGKTPATLCVVRLLQSMGRQVVVSCSGYGSPRAEGATAAPDGPLRASQWGDEAALLRWMLPQVPLVVGRARVRAAELAHELAPQSVLLLDDGFQHLPLRKHVSVVLDAKRATNRRCLPAGPYREPRSNLTRADAVVWTDGPDGPFHLARRPHRYVDPDGQDLRPSRATALCALGQPGRFLEEVASNLELVDPLVLADHDPLSSGTLFDRLPANLPVVVTAKDWVKLRERSDVGTRTFAIAMQEASIEPADAFRAWLAHKLDESTKQSA